MRDLIRSLVKEELKAEDGHYSPLQVLHSAAGYYLGRIFESDDGIPELGSRESDYFPTEKAAQEALDNGFDWRDASENRLMYEIHVRLTDLGNQKLFSVIEYSSFFAVRHNPTGKEHPMGDGVDTLFDENDNALSPGTEGFVEAWEDALNATPDETLEAYFPDEVEES